MRGGSQYRYRVAKDMTAEAYTPTLKSSGILITEITLIYFLILREEISDGEFAALFAFLSLS